MKDKRVGVFQLLALVLGGFFLGFLYSFIVNRLGIDSLIKTIEGFLSSKAVILSLIANAACLGLGIYFYLRAKSSVKEGLASDGFIDTSFIEYSMAAINAGIFILMGFLIIHYGNIHRAEDYVPYTVFMLAELVFFIGAYLITFTKSYRLIREIEPNRKTWAMDIFFNKKFMEESDERDRKKYFKKGYVAYKRSLFTQYGLIVLLFAFAINGKVSPLIPVIILIPSLVGIISYALTGEDND